MSATSNPTFQGHCDGAIFMTFQCFEFVFDIDERSKLACPKP